MFILLFKDNWSAGKVFRICTIILVEALQQLIHLDHIRKMIVLISIDKLCWVVVLPELGVHLIILCILFIVGIEIWIEYISIRWVLPLIFNFFCFFVVVFEHLLFIDFHIENLPEFLHLFFKFFIHCNKFYKCWFQDFLFVFTVAPHVFQIRNFKTDELVIEILETLAYRPCNNFLALDFLFEIT